MVTKLLIMQLSYLKAERNGGRFTSSAPYQPMLWLSKKLLRLWRPSRLETVSPIGDFFESELPVNEREIGGVQCYGTNRPFYSRLGTVVRDRVQNVICTSKPVIKELYYTGVHVSYQACKQEQINQRRNGDGTDHALNRPHHDYSIKSVFLILNFHRFEVSAPRRFISFNSIIKRM